MSEAQSIVDELALLMRPESRTGRAIALPGDICTRILDAATKKPKHPTPDQFYVNGANIGLGRSIPLTEYEVLVASRQLNAANHAIAHLRTIVYNVKDPEGSVGHALWAIAVSKAAAFLRALDNGEDFPEMPK